MRAQGVCGLMHGHYNYTNHGNRLSMQIKSYHNKVCNLEYNKQNNREFYICTTNILLDPRPLGRKGPMESHMLVS